SGSNTFSGGAGIWALNNLAGKSKIIENNTIVNNSATVGTGGVLSWGTTLTLRNNIIRGNTVGAQIVKTGGGIVNATYCNVQGGYTGEGNINIEPAFSDTNFLLAVSSPCVDAGDSSATFNDPEDTANPGSALFPARGTLRNDMGAYGGPRSYSFPVFVVVGVNENSSLVNEFYLLQNYPNPFNPVTTIRFEVRGLGLVSLKVFDVLGREVTTLIHNRVMDEGKHEVEFDASGLTSGVYFYRLSVSHPNESAIRYTQTKKLLLMK
ncbi:MAG: T9SS type A sorting domain-containing protein, partial [Ignavibacteriales bacterium]|nr:T9SS type A sorting domain-containing protein [Ignavibacteriales bacterium]